MAKRFECPRCGSGVRPNDTQCFRCGEIFEDDLPAIQAAQPSAAVNVPPPAMEHKEPGRRARPQPPDSPSAAPTPRAPAAKHGIVEAIPVPRDALLGRKERELEERERAISESVEQLEQDTRALEEALKRFEREDAQAQDRERALKEREMALGSLAERMDQALSLLESNGAASDLAEEAKRLREISEDHSRLMAEERAQQRRLLDQEIEERMERLKTLQGLINAASAMRAGDEAAEGHPEHPLAPPEEGGIEELIRKEQQPRFDEAEVQRALEQVTQEVAAQAEAPQRLDFEVISTHDERLDSILGGGIPLGHVVIVNGPPGSMKSTLNYYIVHNAVAKAGKRAMYFSLEQKRDSIVRQMGRMGLPLEGVADRMMVVDMVDLRKAMKGEKGDWRQIMMRYVKNVHADMPFDLFVLDSLESFKSIAQFDFHRQHMMDLFDWFKSLNITVLVIAEKPLEVLNCSEQGETYLADGVIELLMKEFDDAKVHRWLRCVKMRGMQIDPRFYAFYHTGQEFKFSLPLVDTGR